MMKTGNNNIVNAQFACYDLDIIVREVLKISVYFLDNPGNYQFNILSILHKRISFFFRSYKIQFTHNCWIRDVLLFEGL